MYNYRNLSPVEKQKLLDVRRQILRPWHSPPHWDYEVERQFLVSAACYEHKPIIGITPDRMTEWESILLELCRRYASALYAWCILPNHYHLLIRTGDIADFRYEIGRSHGRTSYRWNGEDMQRGRHVWFNCFERVIKSSRHFWATINYIHHNPIKHGYVKKWQDWPWSSAQKYLEHMGRETAINHWLEYPVLDYGKNWDLGVEDSLKEER